MTDRLIRVTTALAVVAVASVAAIISYQHAYELVRTHGEAGLTARLLPFTVDGLIWAASMFRQHAAAEVTANGSGVPAASLSLGRVSSGLVSILQVELQNPLFQSAGGNPVHHESRSLIHPLAGIIVRVDPTDQQDRFVTCFLASFYGCCKSCLHRFVGVSPSLTSIADRNGNSLDLDDHRVTLIG